MNVTAAFGALSGIGLLALSTGAFGVLDAYHGRNRQAPRVDWLFALYAAGAQMLECYPVVPLAKEQAVTVGLTSYNGGVFFGLNADRDAMPDVDVLALCIEESLGELLETVR